MTQAQSDTRYVNVTGDTVTGDLTLAATGSDGRFFIFGRDGLPQWMFGNSGGNLIAGRYDDTGEWVDNPWGMNRADGSMVVDKPLWLGDPTPYEDNHAASKQYVDTTRVAKAGDTMTGDLKINVARHHGVEFREPGGERRVLGIRTTTSGVAGLGAFKAEDDPTQPLMLQPFGVGAPNQAEHAVNRDYLLTQYDTSTVTPASGWAANSITWMTRNGWAVVTFDSVRKTTAPAANDIMFTLPVGARPISGTWWLSMVGNVATTGGGARVYLGSVESNGQVKIRGLVMPPANEILYATIAFPCV